MYDNGRKQLSDLKATCLLAEGELMIQKDLKMGKVMQV